MTDSRTDGRKVPTQQEIKQSREETQTQRFKAKKAIKDALRGYWPSMRTLIIEAALKDLDLEIFELRFY